MNLKIFPVPYLNVSATNFNFYVTEFKNKTSIKDICNLNDKAILKSVDKNLDDDSIAKLYNIREKLYLRRIKTN